ncbi:ER membrane protein complex subunit 1 [Brevipalpus obovatus]|uniref:ER membrane protein complex subunit 1 n=1 Tax=Brevipalpus obovatus TaxID=246614 RepID=UPI003D9F0537
MLLISYIFSIFFIIPTLCLYEDQIHKWDWRQQFIGIDVEQCLRSNDELHGLLFCGTGQSNVVASLDKDGQIVWRNVQERKSNLIALAFTDSNSLTYVGRSGSPNITTFYIRRWSRDRFGHLLWEQIINVPEFHDCVPAMTEKQIRLICSDNKEKLVWKDFVLDGSKKSSKDEWSAPVSALPNIKVSKNCLTIGNRAFVCLSTYSIHILTLKDAKWTNYPLPEVLSEDKNFELDQIRDENGLDKGFFGIKVASKESSKYYLYSVSTDNLELKHTLDGTRKLAILSDSKVSGGIRFFSASNPDKTGVTVNTFTGSFQDSKKILTTSDQNHAHSIEVRKMFPVKYGDKLVVILSFEDQRLIAMRPNGHLMWAREESISSIIWSHFISLPYFSTHPNDFEYKKLDAFMLINSFQRRIGSQLLSIQNYIVSLYKQFFLNHKEEFSTSESNSVENLISDQFGFHKLIMLVTERGKILIIDNIKKGLVVHSFYDSRLREEIIKEKTKNFAKVMSNCDEVSPISVYTQRSDLFNPLVTILTPKGYILAYNPLNGQMEDRQDLKISVKQSLLMHHSDEEGVKGILLLDVNDKVHLYPKSTRQIFATHKNSYYMLVAQYENEQVEGYSFHHVSTKTLESGEERARKVWSFSLPHLEDSCLMMRWKESEEHVHSQGKVLADRAVLYKYLNPNLVALIHKGQEPGDEDTGKMSVVHFHLLDAITGAIYYSVIHRRASDPVHLLHSENFVIYSFYNEKQRRMEISSLELFEGKESPPPPPPVRTPPRIVEHVSFIFPTGIRAMKETRTIRGITNKHILIALTSGGILSLPKVFLDPRRASLSSPSAKYAASAAAAMEEGGVYLPPYLPELPIPSEGIINYNQSLTEVDKMNVGVSSLESTCLIFITGLDIYHTRITPSKTFDILKDDFDHLLIIVVLVALVLFSVVSKYLASRKSLNAAWK